MARRPWRWASVQLLTYQREDEIAHLFAHSPTTHDHQPQRRALRHHRHQQEVLGHVARGGSARSARTRRGDNVWQRAMRLAGGSAGRACADQRPAGCQATCSAHSTNGVEVQWAHPHPSSLCWANGCPRPGSTAPCVAAPERLLEPIHQFISSRRRREEDRPLSAIFSAIKVTIDSGSTHTQARALAASSANYRQRHVDHGHKFCQSAGIASGGLPIPVALVTDRVDLGRADLWHFSRMRQECGPGRIAAGTVRANTGKPVFKMSGVDIITVINKFDQPRRFRHPR